MKVVWEDPRVLAGLARQNLSRQELVEGGATRVGWKTGLTAEPVKKALGISGGLTGFITTETELPDRAEIDVADWTNPVLEPELAVRIGADIGADTTPELASSFIEAIAPAIEVADVDLPFESPEEILAANIFHRGVVLGDFRSGSLTELVDGLELSLGVGGEILFDHVDPFAVVGDIGSVVAHVARLLAETGEVLSAGDVLITGSAVPPVSLATVDGPVTVEYHGLGEVSVRVSSKVQTAE